ncbi:hypothetical protein Tco_0396845 [Tanacetum coccineum]
MVEATSKFQNLLKIGMLVWGEADSKTSPKRSHFKKSFSRTTQELGEVNPTHAYYNVSCTSKDTEDPSWSTKVEYIATLETAMKAVWTRNFILGLDIVPTINELIKMLRDNSSILLIANEPEVQRSARHYYRRYHYVRECIKLGEINLLKFHTDENLTDPFMKALPKGKLTQHAKSIRLRLASSFM